MKKKLISLVIASVVLTGCTSIAQKKTYGDYETQISTGLMGAATELAIKKADVDKETGQAEDLLWSLEAGSLLRMEKNYEQSSAFFDDAEMLMKNEDTENLLSKGADALASMLVNDTAMDYEQTHYDGIMANSYKALNFMFSGDLTNARVEWNRVDDRQRRAAEEFAEKISKLKAELEEEKAKQSKKNKNQKNPQEPQQSLLAAENLVKTQGLDISEWKVYEDYLNPFSTYMHGLFFLVNSQGNSDINKAYDSFKRAAGMTGNKTAKADMALADSLRSGKKSLKKVDPTVWVILENGLGPKKEEMRIDLPVFLASNNVSYTGMALPKLVSRKPAYTQLFIDEATTTETLAEMDKVVQAEFKAEFPYILSREVVRTVWKTVAQKQMNDENPMIGLMASIAQVATTGADLRMWNSLPKEFQLARLNKPKDNELTISAEGMAAPLTVSLNPKSKFNIVYIRAVSPLVAPSVDVMSI